MDKIIDRIKKLLALANDQAASENEATVALAKARQLMLDHSVSADVLNAEQTERVVTWGAWRGGMDDNWQVYCGIAACRLYGCKLVTDKQGGYRFVGTPEKMDIAELTYRYLVGEIEKRYKLALKVLSDTKATDKRIRADLRRSFKNAAAGVLCDRVNQILAAQATPSNSRALVIVDQDEAAAQALLDSAKTKKKTVTLTSHGIGTYAGREAGKSIKLQEEVK